MINQTKLIKKAIVVVGLWVCDIEIPITKQSIKLGYNHLLEPNFIIKKQTNKSIDNTWNRNL